MYVCLCVAATNQTVSDAVARGASTSKEVAAACGAGADCGRCRRTLRAIIAAAVNSKSNSIRPPRDRNDSPQISNWLAPYSACTCSIPTPAAAAVPVISRTNASRSSTPARPYCAHSVDDSRPPTGSTSRNKFRLLSDQQRERGTR